MSQHVHIDGENDYTLTGSETPEEAAELHQAAADAAEARQRGDLTPAEKERLRIRWEARKNESDEERAERLAAKRELAEGAAELAERAARQAEQEWSTTPEGRIVLALERIADALEADTSSLELAAIREAAEDTARLTRQAR